MTAVTTLVWTILILISSIWGYVMEDYSSEPDKEREYQNMLDKVQGAMDNEDEQIFPTIETSSINPSLRAPYFVLNRCLSTLPRLQTQCTPKRRQLRLSIGI